MRSYDRRSRYVEHIVHYFDRDVRDVDKHAEPVHLSDNVFAKIRKAVILDFAIMRISPIVRDVVRQRHISEPEPVKITQGVERILDRVTALDTHQYTNFPETFRTAYLCG